MSQPTELLRIEHDPATQQLRVYLSGQSTRVEDIADLQLRAHIQAILQRLQPPAPSAPPVPTPVSEALPTPPAPPAAPLPETPPAMPPFPARSCQSNFPPASGSRASTSAHSLPSTSTYSSRLSVT